MKGNKKYDVKYIMWFAAVLALAAFGVLLLLPVWREYRGRRQVLAAREKEARLLKEERDRRLAETTALENSPEAVEKVAREKYRQVGPGETVMTYPMPRSQKER